MSESEAGSRARAVREMFGAIAPRYDFLNRLLSLGIDQQWRRFVARRLADLEEPLVLDVACGTADLSLAVRERNPGARVVGLDFSEEMLRLAAAKVARRGLASSVVFVAGSAEELPFADNLFAGLTIAFGIRNVIDRPRALAEF
ncbi:MAG: class I SAM-dependent methyltransferase, partial [Deltaproteobacteria bacterium]|nr:class I SAM-dependent methyltransferase [Deltaproteobacteria bacterium]